MYGNMTLEKLIEWLEKQDPRLTIKDGFGSPHCDRGSYEEVAFDPVEKTTIGEMLKYAKSALGETFTGWKGGEYTMHGYTSVLIGVSGECGEDITETHFKYWLAIAEAPK